MLLKVYPSQQQPSTILHKQGNTDFLRSCSPFPIRFFRVEDDEVLTSSPTETSPNHYFRILRNPSVPSLDTAVLDIQYSVTRRVIKLPFWICARPNFSSGLVWYSSRVLFSSADIIFYQAEVLQIHCTTTIHELCITITRLSPLLVQLVVNMLFIQLHQLRNTIFFRHLRTKSVDCHDRLIIRNMRLS